MALYKSDRAREQIAQLYKEKLDSLNISYENIDIKTSFGQTRVIKTGNSKGEKIVLFHGINAGSPITIEPIKELTKEYLIYSVDTVGQTTKSAENPIDITDNSYGLWADEVLEGLAIDKANFIGISYGGYILQKLITHRPGRVSKCIFIVPAGLVNGAFLSSFKQLFYPLMKFKLFKKDKDISSFLNAFVPSDDLHMINLQKIMMQGVNVDYRRPTLLKEKDVAHFSNPVFIIVADNDIFFPGRPSIDRAKKLFKNLEGIHILKNCKHIPHKGTFPEIQSKLKEWLN